MSAILRKSFRAQSYIFVNCINVCERTAIANICKTNVLSQEKRISPFSLKGLVKHYELLPLVGILAAGTVGLGLYGVYFCTTRNDVQFRKQETYDPMDLQKPPVLKMVRTKDYREYIPLTELEGLYKEMAEADSKKK